MFEFGAIVYLIQIAISNCSIWFNNIFDSIPGSFKLVFAFIVAGFLTSLILPFIGYRVRAGSSDTAKRFRKDESN